MELYHNLVVREKYKYIEVVYTEITLSVVKMIKEHYDIPEYKDTLFLVNIFQTYDKQLFNPIYFPAKRKIYYNLEHTNDFIYDIYFNNMFIQWVNDFGVTEMWNMEYDLKYFQDRLNIPVKYMPVRYTTYFKKPNINAAKTFDFGFIGRIDTEGCPYRNEVFNQLRMQDVKYKILYGDTISNLAPELANCKFVADIQRNWSDDNETQNQVRIFEHICLGHHVLTERVSVNVFPGLLNEWTGAEELVNLTHTLEPQDFSEKYKEMTYRDEDYENYKNNILSQL